MSQSVLGKATRNILQDEKALELVSELSLGFQMLEMREEQIKIRTEHREVQIFL